MKKISKIIMIFMITAVLHVSAFSQCSVCTKTALQLGEGPAKGLNSAILYLMMMPFAIVGVIGFRWWKNNKKAEDQEMN